MTVRNYLRIGLFVLLVVGCGGDGALSPSKLQQILVVEDVSFLYSGYFIKGRVLVRNTGSDISADIKVTIHMVVFDETGAPLGEGTNYEWGIPSGTARLFENITFFDLESAADAQRIVSWEISWTSGK